jgi:hypothetical protein
MSEDFNPFVATPQHSDPFVVADPVGEDSDSDSSEGDQFDDDDDDDDDPPAEEYGPTVPRSESGSPEKSPTAPLDPRRPRVGMHFGMLEEAVHFTYEYERQRGYDWKKGESEQDCFGE